MSKIIHPELSYQVRGAMLAVYNALGPRLQEHFYRDALALELRQRDIHAEREKGFEVEYEGERVGLYYVDVWIEGGKILLELKVADQIAPLHQAQAISSLKVTGADLAIVANYGEASFADKRCPNFLPQPDRSFHWQPRPISPDWRYPDLINMIQRVCHRVHFILCPGFLHQVYRRATMIELRRNQVAYRYLKHLPIEYKGQVLGQQAVRVILAEDRILVATFAVQMMQEALVEQLKAYLRHLNLQLGMVVNFYGTAPEIKLVRIG